MSLRRAAALAAVACLAMPTARASAHTVTIASFKYTPNDVAVSVGDTVVWRNLDGTVHTVTASRGEFASGSLRQGQEFSATFTVPGLYPYFCEPHESMRGTVSVTGAAPATTTTASTTTTALVVAGTTTPPAARAPGADPSANPAPSVAPVAPGRLAVVAGRVTGHTLQPSPLPAILLVFGGVMALLFALARVGVHRDDALRYVAAVGTAATGVLHAQVRFALAYPEPIGTLLVIEAAGAAILTAWLVTHPWTRTKQLTAIGAHLAALGALAVTRTRLGLFGFHEIGWDPSPQLPVAVTIGILVIALLVAIPADPATTVA